MDERFKEIFIPNGWKGPLAEEVLTVFTEHLNNCAIYLKKNEEDTQSSLLGNVEIECRFGEIHEENYNFVPGIEKDIFNGMRNHLLGLVNNKTKKWWQQPMSKISIENSEKSQVSLVKCVETEYLDVLFDDNVRITFRLYFSDKNLTILSKLKVIEIIRKNKFGSDRTFSVKNIEKKQCFDMRLSAASEETLNLNKDNSYNTHVEFAKNTIRKSYSSSRNERIFGGCPITISEKAQTKDIKLLPLELTNMETNDVILNYAKNHNWNISINIVRQMKWTMLQPKNLPSLNGLESSILRPYSNETILNFNSLVYLTNLPCRVKLRDDSCWVCSSNQYVIAINFSFLNCSVGKFANLNTIKETTNDNLKIIHFRKKTRTSFKIRNNITLDMTRIQQSLTPSTISVENSNYELEIEVLIDLKYKLNNLTSTNLTIDMITDIATYVYGIKLNKPNDEILKSEIWKNAFENDKKRIELLNSIKFNKSLLLNDNNKQNLKRKLVQESIQPKVKKIKSAQSEATSFYNQLNRTQNQRSESLIYHLRCFNNFSKSILIQEYINKTIKATDSDSLVILDLACGKGGDLNKFSTSLRESYLTQHRRVNIEKYIGLDIALQTLRDFVSRLENSKRGKRNKASFPIVLGELDLGSSGLILTDKTDEPMKIWEKDTQVWKSVKSLDFLESLKEKVDLVSIQFSLHYMFESEVRADSYFRFVSNCLKVGGFMIATTVESNRLISNLLQSGPLENSFKIIDNRNRPLCEVKFNSIVRNKLFKTDKTKETEEKTYFGLKYNFKLRDSEKEDATTVSVNAPEWLIIISDLYVVARRHGLKLVLYENLNKFTFDKINENSEQKQKYLRLMKHMNILNSDGLINKTEFKICSLYVAIAFEKVDEGYQSDLNISDLLREMKENIPNFQDLPQSLRAKMFTRITRK